MSLIDAANRVFNKIKREDVPIAVFIRSEDSGSIAQTTKANSDLFAAAMKSPAHKLLGIYNSDCEASWIDDDLAYADLYMTV